MSDVVNPATGEIIPEHLLALAREVIAARDAVAALEADLAAYVAPLQEAKRRAERAATEVSERFVAAASASNVQSVPIGLHTVSVVAGRQVLKINADARPEDYLAYVRINYEWDKTAIANAIKGGERVNFATLQENVPFVRVATKSRVIAKGPPALNVHVTNGEDW